MAGEGKAEYTALIDGGFSQTEADAWKQEQSKTLAQGGFKPSEIDDYWGDKDPDKPGVFDAAVVENMRANWLSKTGVADPNDPLEMLAAGYGMSVSGLLQSAPKVVAPEHAGVFGRIMSGIGQFAGDAPATIAGFAGGFVAGGAAGGAAGAETGPGALATATGGAAIGGGMGAAALPEAMRSVMIDAYRNGEILSWDDAVERAGVVIWNTTKAAAVGGLAAPVGGVVGGRVLNKAGARVAAAKMGRSAGTGNVSLAMAANGATQALTSTALFGAAEGRVPDAEDFVAGAALALGFHTAGELVGAANRYRLKDRGERAKENMEDIYAETGITPWDAGTLMKSYPELRQAFESKDASLETATGPFYAHAPDEPPRFGANPMPFGGEGGDALTNAPAAQKVADLAKNTRADHDAEVQDLETKAMERAFNAQLTPDQQLGVITRLENSFGAAKQRGVSEHEVVSPKGAIGRYQIMPGTGKLYGYSRQDLFDPVKNRECAKKIVKDLSDKYRFSDGSVDMEAVLIAYNAGPGRANKFRTNGRDYSKLPTETQRYLQRAEKMGAISGNPMREAPGEAYGIVQRPGPDNWRGVLNLQNADVFTRKLPSGEIVSDPNAVASYLKKFGQEAGFKFMVGKPQEAMYGADGPRYSEDIFMEKKAGEVVNKSDKIKMVWMPDTPDETLRRWYGLGRSEVLHHEVGHALHIGVLDHAKNTMSRVLRDEMEAASKQFRPLFWSDEGVGGASQKHHVLKNDELFADAIAIYMTDPTSHMRMPEFVKLYGDKLAKYKFFIDRNLPRRKEGGKEWEPPPEGGGGGEEPPEQPAAAGGGGGLPPGPPKNTGVGPAGPTPPRGPKPVKLSEEILRAKIEDMISQPDEPGILDRGRSLVRTTMMKYVSELDPFRQVDLAMIAEEKLRPEEVGLEDMARSVYASKDRAAMFMWDGPFDPIKFERRSNASLERAFQSARDAGGDEYGFITYLIAQRALEKAKQGIDAVGKKGESDIPFFTLDEAQQYVDKVKGRYDKAADIKRDMEHWLFEYERESSVYNRDQIKRMKDANKYYIPFKRDLGDKSLSLVIPRGLSRFGPRQRLQKMKGSDKQILEPTTALIEGYMARIALADRNRFIGHLVGLAEQGDLSNVLRIEDKRPPMEYQDPKGKIHVLDWNEPLPEDVDPGVISQLGLSYGEKHGKNTFVFLREGKPELWQVDDPDIASVIRGLPMQQPGPITAVLRLFASLKRAGVTQSPDYIMRNVLRDAQSAAVLEKFGGAPLVNFLHGFWHVLGNTEAFKQYTREGGFGAALVEMDTNHLRRNVERIFQETGTVSAVTNYVRHPIEAMQVLMSRMDAMSRVGAKMRAEKAGLSGFKAAISVGRKSSLDFAERGTSATLAWWAGVTPFLRPYVLGMKQMGEAYARRPAETAARHTAYVALPSVLLYGINYLYDQGLDEDDQTRWENTDRWVRDSHWIIPLPGGGEKLKLPVLPVIGPIMNGLITRTLDHMVANDRDAFVGFMDTVFKQFMPPLPPFGYPAAVEPFVEHLTNHSFFKGEPLIPPSLEDASGYMQYAPYTSEAAKAVSRVLGPMNLDAVDVSPIVLDNYVRQWTGTLGSTLLKILDVPIKTDQPYEWADNPFVGSFLLRHSGGEMIDRFYEKAKEVTRARRDLALAKGRDDDAMLDYTSDQDEAYLRLDGIKQSLAVQRSVIDGIRNDKDMTVDDKRQLIDELTRGMIATARDGIEAADSIK